MLRSGWVEREGHDRTACLACVMLATEQEGVCRKTRVSVTVVCARRTIVMSVSLGLGIGLRVHISVCAIEAVAYGLHLRDGIALIATLGTDCV